ncbi:MAG: 30S ribosome-binding factor RbfA [Actinomycetota bacterium]|jgi:ribosome-binding factor A|nr:30S ribosome-binding factor RbfA [Actinomycetota bacterium]
MKSTPRTRKLGVTVREAIASIIQGAIADPRLDLITVTSVDVSSDLSIANVYVTAHGDEERYKEVLEGLESAKGRIRSLLGRAVKMRITPDLRFFIDPSVDEGFRMSVALQDVPPTLANSSDVHEDDASEG